MEVQTALFSLSLALLSEALQVVCPFLWGLRSHGIFVWNPMSLGLESFS